MTSVPLVSIVVPNFNHRPYLPQRLESICQQTFQDYEVILLDDASTDGSPEFLEQIAEELGARFQKNEQNSGGPFGQWNRGVELAKGKYIWLAESDDSAEPQFLESLIPILEAHPEIVLAEANSLQMDPSGKILGSLSRSDDPDLVSHWEHDFIAEGNDEIRNHLYIQNTIPSASAVVFRREAYLQTGGADPSLRVSGDWLMWASLICDSKRYYSATPLSYTRIHADSQRARTASDGRFELESLRVQQLIRKQISIDKSLRHRGAKRYAAVRLHSVRSAQYSGSTSNHLSFFGKLWSADKPSACRFLCQLSYCLPIGVIKRLLGRTSR